MRGRFRVREVTTSSFFEAIPRFLEDRGWSLAQCRQCGVSFFARPRRAWCGRATCTTPASPAVTRPRFPDQVWETVRSYFANAQFISKNRSDLANPSRRATRFVGAGLQVFEDALERGVALPPEPLFVPQPVIRLNYWPTVGVRAATSTSFINLCTEHAHSSLMGFLRHLDLWLILLDRLAIPRHETSVFVGPERWRGGPFSGPSLSVEVRGLEIGDAVFIDEVASGAGSYLPIADFSFGLERIVAAVNPGLPYYVFLGPLPESALPENERAIDRVRTATLIAMAGVAPSSRGHGRHLRRAVADAFGQGPTLNLAEIAAHAYCYWSSVFAPSEALSDCQVLLEAERSRAKAQKITRLCRTSASRIGSLSADQLCRRVLASDGNLETVARCASDIAGLT